MQTAAKPSAPPTREARFARRLLWLIPASLLGLALLTRLAVTSSFVSEWVAEFVAGVVADRTGTSVQLSGVSFGLTFAPCLDDLTLSRDVGPVQVRIVSSRACVERWASALGSGFRAVQVRLEAPAVEVVGGEPDAVPPPTAAKKKKAGGADEARPDLREVEVVFDDLRLRWESLPLPGRFGEGSFGPIDGAITVQVRGPQSAAMITLQDPSSGAAVNARANPTPTGWNLSAGLSGDLVPMFGSLLSSSLLDIQKMPVRGQAGLDYVSASRRLTVDLDLEEHDAAVEAEAVAKEAVTGFEARQRARAQIDLEARTLSVDEALVEVNGVPVVLSVAVQPGASSPAFSVKADLRTTPFARLLKSVPGGEALDIARRMSPTLAFALSASITGELKDPTTWEPQLEHQFQAIDPKTSFTGLEFLEGPFPYYPLTPDGRRAEARTVGPTTPSWVPYAKIPYVQRRAIIVSEDANFPFHRGVDLEEVRAALRDTIGDEDEPRGGSTITQQLVKNLFLSRDRTAQRKALELLLTFHLESWLSKDDIFALYANIIEWGPDVYGLSEASQHYFGRAPARLSPLEMAYLATLIPSPIPLHKHYEDGSVPKKHMRKVIALLERLNRLGQLSDDALAEARGGRIRFTRPRPKDE
ncbi:MAG: transglycosylase domain-containing protein [Deltaproteobacteria bacterium]|nr:transglycosylase domain-containing protein [Deltaproteobacteria bacterium]